METADGALPVLQALAWAPCPPLTEGTGTEAECALTPAPLRWDFWRSGRRQRADDQRPPALHTPQNPDFEE